MTEQKYDPQERRYRKVLEELKILRNEIAFLKQNAAVEFPMNGSKHKTSINGSIYTHYPQHCTIVGNFVVFQKCGSDIVEMITTADKLDCCLNGSWK